MSETSGCRVSRVCLFSHSASAICTRIAVRRALDTNFRFSPPISTRMNDKLRYAVDRMPPLVFLRFFRALFCCLTEKV